MKDTAGQPANAGATVAVVLCAGQGSRMGAAQNKMFLPLAGEPVATHAVRAFERSPEVDEILVVAHPDEIARVRAEILEPAHFHKVRGVIAGGASRHQSERCALDTLRERVNAGDIAIVLIHDGARPLTSGDDIARLIATVRSLGASGGALLATPLAPDEHLASIGADGVVTQVFAPEDFARAQTPQGFDARTLLAAYDRAASVSFEGTDTASVVEAAGGVVAITPGDDENIKVTTPDDLLRAQAILRARAQAMGFPEVGGNDR